MRICNFILMLPFLLSSVRPHTLEESHAAQKVPVEKILYINRIAQSTILAVALFILLGILYFIFKYRKFKKNEKTARINASEMTPEEVKALYGEDIPEEFLSPDKLSRQALRSIAEKELAKEGRKVGEKKYFEGPLDWEDVDENFKPRPKVIRSDFSSLTKDSDKTDSDKSTDDNK